ARRRFRDPPTTRRRRPLTTTHDRVAPSRTRPRPRPPAKTRARGAADQPPRARKKVAPRRPPAPRRRGGGAATARPSRRLAVCSTIIVIVFGVLTARVAQLQLMSGDRYENLATHQSLKTIPVSAARGSVFDRNGRDLALSIDRPTVYADPTLVADPL